MKVRDQHGEQISAKSSGEIIVSTWRQLGSPVVGASELTRLHQALAEVFGSDEVPSPARIARQLAQEGAVLRHPEIIESDARWRQAQIAGRLKVFDNLLALQTREPLKFNQTTAILAELEELRGRFVSAGDDPGVAEVKRLAIEAREAAKNHAEDESVSSADRDVQTEISEWFRVWLETPNLFSQWLELRRSSAAFKEKFCKSV